MRELNILITSIGRRIHLQSSIKNALLQTKQPGKIIVIDSSWSAPGLKYSDRGYVVPKSLNANYTNALLSIIEKEEISHIIPTSDLDLFVLTRDRNVIEEQNAILLAPSNKMVRKLSDKIDTEIFFKSLGLQTPKVFLDKNSVSDYDYPVVVKERGRNAVTTKGFRKVANEESISVHLNQIEEPIIQQFIGGTEFTIDALSDLRGNPLAIVPRERISIRQHVSDKGVTVQDPLILEESFKILSEIKAKGFCNLQCIKKDNTNYWIEVNPRTSGGFPLFLAACQKVPFLFIEVLLCNNVDTIIGDYEVDCFMAKYDEVLISNSDKKIKIVSGFKNPFEIEYHIV